MKKVYMNRTNELINLANDLHNNFTPEKLKALRALCREYDCAFDIERKDEKNGIENTRVWLVYHPAPAETLIFDAWDIPDGDYLIEFMDIGTALKITGIHADEIPRISAGRLKEVITTMQKARYLTPHEKEVLTGYKTILNYIGGVK